jgi:DNA polymerase-3 subunit beta
VLFEGLPDGLRLVATDAYRLIVRDVPDVRPLPPGERVVVPAQAVLDLAERVRDIRDVERLIVDETARVATGARFPLYEQYVHDRTTRVLVARRSFLDALRGLRRGRGCDLVARVNLTGEGVTLRSDAGTVVVVPGSLTGRPVATAVNVEFMRFGVDAAHGRMVSVDAVDDRAPVAVRTVDAPGSCLYVLAPFRFARP